MEFVGVSAETHSEMIVHAEESSLRDDRLVRAKKPVSQFRYLHVGVGKHHAPGFWHVAMQRGHPRDCLLHQLSISVQDVLRTSSEEGPPLERPHREQLRDRGPADGRVVLHGLELLQEARMSHNPPDSERAEATDLRHRGQCNHPGTEFSDARRRSVEGELAECLVHEDIAVTLLGEVRQFLKILSSDRGGGRVVQVREHEELRPTSDRLSKSVEIEGPSVSATPRDRDYTRTETRGTIAQG